MHDWVLGLKMKKHKNQETKYKESNEIIIWKYIFFLNKEEQFNVQSII